MDNIAATRFFAQLVRQQHGPPPKEKSPTPSPPPADVTDSHENTNSGDLQIVDEVVTINDDDMDIDTESETGQETTIEVNPEPPREAVDGEVLDGTRHPVSVPQEIKLNSTTQGTIQLTSAPPPVEFSANNIPVIPSLMQLPFPPGMDGIKNNVSILTNPILMAGLPNATTQAIYNNLQGASLIKKQTGRNITRSITRDLPMPPGTLFKLFKC